MADIDITQLVSLRTNEAERAMTARAFGILSYRASYSPGEGCVLQD